MPVFAGLVAVAPSLVPVGLGQQWFPSIWLTQVLALASLGYCLSFFFGLVLTSLGRPGLRLGVVTGSGAFPDPAHLDRRQIRRHGRGGRHGRQSDSILWHRTAGLAPSHEILPGRLSYGRVGSSPAAIAWHSLSMLLGHAMAGSRPILLLLAQVALGAVLYGGIMLVFARGRLPRAFRHGAGPAHLRTMDPVLAVGRPIP